MAATFDDPWVSVSWSPPADDGGLLVVTLDDSGREASKRRSPPFFDPEQDPLIVSGAGTGVFSQAELAQMIQEGLAAKSAGDERTATTKLGRAVQLATESGNAEATAKLRKVVDISDARTGTVRLKRAVDKADEMALDTASTKTTRIRG